MVYSEIEAAGFMSDKATATIVQLLCWIDLADLLPIERLR